MVFVSNHSSARLSRDPITVGCEKEMEGMEREREREMNGQINDVQDYTQRAQYAALHVADASHNHILCSSQIQVHISSRTAQHTIKISTCTYVHI